MSVDPPETLDSPDLLGQLDFPVDQVRLVQLVHLVLKVSKDLPVILEYQVPLGHLDQLVQQVNVTAFFLH